MTSQENNAVFRLCLLSEILIFIVAIIIICVFAILLFYYFPTNEESGQAIFTGFIAWIGAIIGFYFGQKPVRDVITRLQDKEREYAHRSELTDKAIDEYNYVVYKLNKELENLIKEGEKE